MSIKNKAFTLVELLVVVLISSILIGISVSTYSLFRKSITQDQNKANISQNARVAFDRISRELRQTPEVITELPADVSDTSIAQPHEIEFQDGHEEPGTPSSLTYRRYYISNNLLKLDINEYYFSYATGTRVRWDSVGTSGQDPVKHVISTQDIAETVQTMNFYGSKPLQFEIITGDGANQTFKLRTKLYERNI